MNIEKVESDLAAELGIGPLNVCVVGSTLICGKGNDIDLLCLVPSDDCLRKAGFEPDTKIQYESALHSWRRGEINIIAVENKAFFLAEVAIAHAAKQVQISNLDMRDRDDRVIFHSAVRDAVMGRMDANVYDDILDI